MVCCLPSSNPMGRPSLPLAMTMQKPDTTTPNLERWLRSQEKSLMIIHSQELRQDAPKMQSKKNLFWGQNRYSLASSRGRSWATVPFSIFWLRFPRRTVTSLASEFWRMKGAPMTKLFLVSHSECALWMLSQLIHEGNSPGKATRLWGGKRRCGSPVMRWTRLMQWKNY